MQAFPCSYRFEFCLIVSKASKLMKQVICSRKSIRRAIPAYRANALTAGMSDKLPRKKQELSDTLVSNMLGPTWPRVRPMCCAFVSPGLRMSR